MQHPNGHDALRSGLDVAAHADGQTAANVNPAITTGAGDLSLSRGAPLPPPVGATHEMQLQAMAMAYTHLMQQQLQQAGPATPAALATSHVSPLPFSLESIPLPLTLPPTAPIFTPHADAMQRPLPFMPTTPMHVPMPLQVASLFPPIPPRPSHFSPLRPSSGAYSPIASAHADSIAAPYQPAVEHHTQEPVPAASPVTPSSPSDWESLAPQWSTLSPMPLVSPHGSPYIPAFPQHTPSPLSPTAAPDAALAPAYVATLPTPLHSLSPSAAYSTVAISSPAEPSPAHPHPLSPTVLDAPPVVAFATPTVAEPLPPIERELQPWSAPLLVSQASSPPEEQFGLVSSPVSPQPLAFSNSRLPSRSPSHLSSSAVTHSFAPLISPLPSSPLSTTTPPIPARVPFSHAFVKAAARKPYRINHTSGPLSHTEVSVSRPAVVSPSEAEADFAFTQPLLREDEELVGFDEAGGAERLDIHVHYGQQGPPIEERPQAANIPTRRQLPPASPISYIPPHMVAAEHRRSPSPSRDQPTLTGAFRTFLAAIYAFFSQQCCRRSSPKAQLFSALACAQTWCPSSIQQILHSLVLDIRLGRWSAGLDSRLNRWCGAQDRRKLLLGSLILACFLLTSIATLWSALPSHDSTFMSHASVAPLLAAQYRAAEQARADLLEPVVEEPPVVAKLPPASSYFFFSPSGSVDSQEDEDLLVDLGLYFVHEPRGGPDGQLLAEARVRTLKVSPSPSRRWTLKLPTNVHTAVTSPTLTAAQAAVASVVGGKSASKDTPNHVAHLLRELTDDPIPGALLAMDSLLLDDVPFPDSALAPAAAAIDLLLEESSSASQRDLQRQRLSELRQALLVDEADAKRDSSASLAAVAQSDASKLAEAARQQAESDRDRKHRAQLRADTDDQIVVAEAKARRKAKRKARRERRRKRRAERRRRRQAAAAAGSLVTTTSAELATDSEEIELDAPEPSPTSDAESSLVESLVPSRLRPRAPVAATSQPEDEWPSMEAMGELLSARDQQAAIAAAQAARIKAQQHQRGSDEDF